MEERGRERGEKEVVVVVVVVVVAMVVVAVVVVPVVVVRRVVVVVVVVVTVVAVAHVPQEVGVAITHVLNNGHRSSGSTAAAAARGYRARLRRPMAGGAARYPPRAWHRAKRRGPPTSQRHRD